MNKHTLRLVVVLVVSGLCGCYAPALAPQGDIDLSTLPGLRSLGAMSPAEYHSAVEVSYLDGQLTKEQARRAHKQIDLRGL